MAKEKTCLIEIVDCPIKLIKSDCEIYCTWVLTILV